MVDVQRLSDDIRHRHAGIQRRIGILEDHGGLGAERLDILGRLDGLSSVDDLTGCGLVQMQDRSSRRGLAASGLSYQAKGLTFTDRERDIIHRLEGRRFEETGIDIEILL